MDIMFEIVSRQKYSALFPTSHVFGEAGGYIGRSEECEWVLPDKSKHISRKHALITFEDGNFFIEDVSANGVQFSLNNDAIGKGKRHKIEHGEGFVIGEYTLMARLLYDPRVYAASADGLVDPSSSFSRSLSLHPLTAMDQEEELIARNRLGDFDDLLGEHNRVASILPADHTDPRINTFTPAAAVPESVDLIPEDWDDDPFENLTSPVAPVPATAQTTSVPPAAQPAMPVQAREAEYASASELDTFFKALGFAAAPASAEERARVLGLAASLLVTAVTGLTHAMRNRNECKNELRLPVTTTGLGFENNPFKFSPSSESALSTLLGPAQKGVLSPVESMRTAFADLHAHHMGLMAGTRAAVRASLERVSPRAVEDSLDANGPVRFNRTGRLWHTFARVHQDMCDGQDGFAAIFLQDFARAYEMQGRTLGSDRVSKGERR